MKTSQDGINLIKYFEGLHDGDLSKIGLQPKLCPAGYWTEGYGHVIIHNGRMLEGKRNKDLAYSLAKINTEQEASNILLDDLVRFENTVIASVKPPITQHQFDALVSFSYNVGKGNFRRSTLLKKLNGMVFADAKILDQISFEFLKWNKARDPETGKMVALKGLTLRRVAEKSLFLKRPEMIKNIISEIDALSTPKGFEITKKFSNL